jgi:ABC-type cobalamin/Fe3+-siderophores transport system ATPase subunit
MKKGEFIDVGTPNEVITASNLEKLYNIKVKAIDVDSGINRKICVPIESCGQTLKEKI